MPMRGDEPIVIVEDDAVTAQIFGMELKDAGYQVQLMPTAESALAFFEHNIVKAAIVDLHLPALDGLALVKQLRARDLSATTPIVLVTGDYALDESIVAELAALHVQVYFKPIWADELHDLVRSLTA